MPDFARVPRIFSYQQLRSCVFTLLYRKQKLCPNLALLTVLSIRQKVQTEHGNAFTDATHITFTGIYKK